MQNSKETAEAILIVIKKILKWILLVAVSIGAIIGVVVSYANYKSNQDYKIKKDREDKISITADSREVDCQAGYPYFYGIVNKSDKTVSSVTFSVELRRKGFSNSLNSYTSIDEDKILKPGEGYGRCFRATSKDYTGEVKEKEVDIVITYKNVTFID